MTTSLPSRPGTAPSTRPTTVEAAPLLLLFSEYTSGQSRRMDGFVSHVLQRRHNHGSFRYRIVLREQRPDLFERFRITTAPTLLVIHDGAVQGRLEGYHRPGVVERLLAPWLH